MKRVLFTGMSGTGQSSLIALLRDMGWTPDEIVEAHPHLTLAQVHDALSYYYDHQAASDVEIAADEKFLAELRASYSSKLDQSAPDQNLHG